MVLEYKQELLNLATDYSEFKSFVQNEIDQMNIKTKEQLQQIEEQQQSLSEKISKMQICTKNEAKSLHNTELELDFYDNNAPQVSLLHSMIIYFIKDYFSY